MADNKSNITNLEALVNECWDADYSTWMRDFVVAIQDIKDASESGDLDRLMRELTEARGVARAFLDNTEVIVGEVKRHNRPDFQAWLKKPVDQ